MRPRPEPTDPYATLGLARGATRAEVRRAYRQRALAVHPDVTGTDSTDEMARLNHARDQLLSSPPPAGQTDASGPTMGAPRASRPERPSWATAHEAAWTDHWSAWNELPKRGHGTGRKGTGTPAAGPDDA